MWSIATGRFGHTRVTQIVARPPIFLSRIIFVQNVRTQSRRSTAHTYSTLCANSDDAVHQFHIGTVYEKSHDLSNGLTTCAKSFKASKVHRGLFNWIKVHWLLMLAAVSMSLQRSRR